jgi:serine-type D-Ala-D-Ala carboxypeptidase
MKKKKKSKGKKILLLAIVVCMIIFLYKKEYIEINTYVAEENSLDAEKIILVNKDNKIPDDYKANLVEYEGHFIDSSIASSLDKMVKSAKREGINLKINTAYRDTNEQQEIYERRVNLYVKKGNTKEQAIVKTNLEVQKPGYSEHETGLALDFSNPNKPEENADMWKWLESNSYKYGFILRYPKDKTNITKVSNEEWHYRYVGKDIAKEMKMTGKCLEEYVNNLL